MSDSSSLGITFVFDLLIVSPVLFSARSCMVHSRVKGGGGQFNSTRSSAKWRSFSLMPSIVIPFRRCPIIDF